MGKVLEAKIILSELKQEQNEGNEDNVALNLFENFIYFSGYAPLFDMVNQSVHSSSCNKVGK
jgi:hypothetical protein